MGTAKKGVNFIRVINLLRIFFFISRYNVAELIFINGATCSPYAL